MEYVRDVFGYYLKNFVYLVLFAIVPAVFIGLFFSPFGMYEFVFNYHNLEIVSFGDMFFQVFHFSWWSILYFVIGLCIMVVFLSLMFGFVESHFRTGYRELKNTFSLNSNVWGVFKSTLILLFLTFILNVLVLLLIYFVHFLGATDGVGSIFNNIFNYIIVLIAMVLTGRMFSLFCYATVAGLLEGTPTLLGLSGGVQAMARKGMALVLVEIVTFGLCFVLMQIFAALSLGWLGNVLSGLIFIPLIVVNSMVLFFDTNHYERKDNLKYYQRK